MATREKKALIDTGADCCVIPETLRRELGIPPRGEARVSGVHGDDSRSYPTCYVDFTIGGINFRNIEVVSIPGEEYVILGRDVLNQKVLHADGPAQFFEFS